MTRDSEEPAGKLLAVCLGPGGLPKGAVDMAMIGELGLEGDGHRFELHGGRHRAVCLLAEEEVRLLKKDGVEDCEPGAFGENLRIEGVDLDALIPGDRLAIGEEVELQMHDLREPCKTLQSVDSRFPDLMIGRSGILCEVIRSGEVRPGQIIRVLSAN